MNKELAKQTKATITSLFKQLDLDVVPLEQLNVILSTPPPATWVKVHPFIKNYNYLPMIQLVPMYLRYSHFGDLFGANLNRKDIVQFTGDTELLSNEAIHTSKEKERVEKHIQNANNVDTLVQVESLVNKYELEIIYNDKMHTLKNGK